MILHDHHEVSDGQGHQTAKSNSLEVHQQHEFSSDRILWRNPQLPKLGLFLHTCNGLSDWDMHRAQRFYKPWGAHGGPWWPMVAHGGPWWPMVAHGGPWWPMASEILKICRCIDASKALSQRNRLNISPPQALHWNLLCQVSGTKQAAPACPQMSPMSTLWHGKKM